MGERMSGIEEINIGPIYYEVGFVENLRAKDGTKLDGWIRYDTSEILMDDSLGSQRALHVLWHEIMHGIFEDAAVDQPDEQTVSAVGNRMIELIRDNPELVRVTQDKKPIIRRGANGEEEK